MARDAHCILVGAAAQPDEWRAIDEAVRSFPEITEVRELLTLILGPDALLVVTAVDLADDLDANRIERVYDEIDDRRREVVPDVTEVFVDATPPGWETRRGCRFRRYTPEKATSSVGSADG